MNAVKLILLGHILIISLLQHSGGTPLQVNYSSCAAVYYGSPEDSEVSSFRGEYVNCCPPRPYVVTDFKLPPAPPKLRVRPALQCLEPDSENTKKLIRAYELMRQLPPEDPRSLHGQANLHCTYCTGAFVQEDSTDLVIDVHSSWFFFPWHRMFTYFHERILQGLLGDPDFVLPFWNWDNPGSSAPSSNSKATCHKAGNLFPQFYNDPSMPMYDSVRSRDHAMAPTIISLAPELDAPGLERKQVIKNNLNAMYNAMVSGASTTETFTGSEYRKGDFWHRTRGTSGVLESGPHTAVHLWVSLDGTSNSPDMADVRISAGDPIFYPHHANVDRLWDRWLTYPHHTYYNDTDWSTVGFYFYDENAQLVRAKVSDFLDSAALGYTNEVVDNVWEKYRAASCSTSDARKIVIQRLSVPTPLLGKQSAMGEEERVTVKKGESFTTTLQRTPRNSRVREGLSVEQDGNDDDMEEILVIREIYVDLHKIVSFDVFINLPEAGRGTLRSCVEYIGRFHHLPRLLRLNGDASNQSRRNQFVNYKVSITRTLEELQMDMLPNVFVTVVPSSFDISFGRVTIEGQSRITGGHDSETHFE